MVVVYSFRDTNMPIWPLWWKIKTGDGLQILRWWTDHWWTDSKFRVTSSKYYFGVSTYDPFVRSLFLPRGAVLFHKFFVSSECVLIYGSSSTGGGDVYLAKVIYRLQTHHYSQRDLGGSIQRNWISVLVTTMLIIYSRSFVVNWPTQGRQSYYIGSCWIILDSCLGKGE